jgi:hypothetical protein
VVGDVNIAAVRREIGTALATIVDLNVTTGATGAVCAPAAIVGLPDEVTYNAAYQRGMDTAVVPVLLLLARPHEADTGDAMGDYLSGTGPRSVRAAVEARSYQACDTVMVTRAGVDIVTVGGIDYLAADFDLDVAGSGLGS